MIYDLGDPAKWEFLFPNIDKPLLSLHPNEDDSILDLDDDEVCKLEIRTIFRYKYFNLLIIQFSRRR